MPTQKEKPATRRGVAMSDEPTDPFNKFLWNWWRKSGLSQPECAEQLGVSVRSFQRWLAGDAPSTLAKQQVISSLESIGVKVPKKLK